MATPPVISETPGHLFTLFSSLALGIGLTELLAHLGDDYGMLRDWRWANVGYFGTRWAGILTMTSYVVLACIGQSAPSSCYGVYVFAHIMCSTTSLFASSIFWTRCAVLCDWNWMPILPLALYALAIFCYGLASSVKGYERMPDHLHSLVCVVALKSSTQAIHRFLLASLDVAIAITSFWSLWRATSTDSWLQPLLFQDQVVYVIFASATYVGLGVTFLTDSPIGRGLGILCPSVVSSIACRLYIQLKRKGKNHARNKMHPTLRSHLFQTPLPRQSVQDSEEGSGKGMRANTASSASDHLTTSRSHFLFPRPATSGGGEGERSKWPAGCSLKRAASAPLPEEAVVHNEHGVVRILVDTYAEGLSIHTEASG